MATKNTTACSTLVLSSGWKINDSTIAIGIHRTITTIFQPAK